MLPLGDPSPLELLIPLGEPLPPLGDPLLPLGDPLLPLGDPFSLGDPLPLGDPFSLGDPLPIGGAPLRYKKDTFLESTERGRGVRWERSGWVRFRSRAGMGAWMWQWWQLVESVWCSGMGMVV